MRTTLAVGLIAAGLALASPVAAQTTTDPAAAKAGTYVIEPDHTKVVFSLNHLGFSTYTGVFPAATGTLVLDPSKPEQAQLDVTIDVAAVDTSHDKLEAHLRSADFLDAGAFPTARFKSTKVERTGTNTARITGDLTLKGVTRPVTLDATFNQAGVNFVNNTYSLGFDATGTLKRSEFGVSAYLPAVGDEITLRIGAELQLKP